MPSDADKIRAFAIVGGEPKRTVFAVEGARRADVLLALKAPEMLRLLRERIDCGYTHCACSASVKCWTCRTTALLAELETE